MLGGFNVEDPYFATPDKDGWADLGFTVEGPILERVEAWFDELERWVLSPKASLRTIRRLLLNWDGGDGPVQLLIGGPTRGLSSWAKCVRSDLTGARRLDMLMAYFSPSNRSMRAVARVARRDGARLVMAAKSDNGATIGATRSLYDYLLKRRAKIWEFEASKLHTKLIVIDDKSFFGSANFDMRSLFLNLEMMLRIEDAALADRLRRYFEHHLPAAEEITPEIYAERRTLLNRIRWRLSWFLVAVVDYTVSRRLNLGLSPPSRPPAGSAHSYALWYSPSARSLNLVILGSKRRRTLPVEPWRCLPMISSARP
jgi:cardiolipin synthase